MAEEPKKKRIVTHSTSSEEYSPDIDTDAGSQEVLETERPRFRINGAWKQKGVVEFRGRKSHVDCNFENDDFEVLYFDISRAEILKIAATIPQCLDCPE